ncbi:mus38-like protein [Ophiostoma piceae UAMH 11346]|uniref:Mus38-like protein n=1 Tax=Ophiostoma piceae (strain UAMH 11346) TaxID=1262450 RepID=S3BXY7_OPHP1|nr:mus38-like protein [Ophiostoma piceae UAMH 11346]
MTWGYTRHAVHAVAQCDEIARSLTGTSKLTDVDTPGSTSYTIVCGDDLSSKCASSVVVSFREPGASIDMALVSLARDIHGTLVPEAKQHGTVEGSDPPLAIYTMPFADGTFVPYELEEGEVNLRATAVAPGFFQEFASFLYLNKLSDLVALQVLDDAKEERRVELLVGSEGTLMVDEKDMVQLQPATLTTGWSFQVRNDGIISCKGKDVYSPTQKHTHRVFQDTKLLKTVGDWQKALVEEGILADE